VWRNLQQGGSGGDIATPRREVGSAEPDLDQALGCSVYWPNVSDRTRELMAAEFNFRTRGHDRGLLAIIDRM
jgi:hypothetical protein